MCTRQTIETVNLVVFTMAIPIISLLHHTSVTGSVVSNVSVLVSTLMICARHGYSAASTIEEETSPASETGLPKMSETESTRSPAP